MAEMASDEPVRGTSRLMTYFPSHEPRLKALEATLVALTKAVIEVHGALSEISITTDNALLKTELAARTKTISGLLDEAVTTISGIGS